MLSDDRRQPPTVFVFSRLLANKKNKASLGLAAKALAANFHALQETT
jgi:hypothetical protein